MKNDVTNSWDYAIAALIYVVSLAVMITYLSITPIATTSDHGKAEYSVYQTVLQNGEWTPSKTSFVASSVISTLVPAKLNKMLGIEGRMPFDILPIVFYALLPVFTYLTARQYLSRGYSICAVTVIISSSAFVYTYGRVGIATGFFAGAVWAMLTGRHKLALLFVVILPFAHYGTTYYTIAFITASVAFYIVRRQLSGYNFRLLSAALATLLIVTAIWLGTVNEAPNQAAKRFVNKSAISALTVVSPPDTNSPNTSLVVKEARPLDTQEPLVQDAFGKGLSSWILQKKVGWILSWGVIGLITLGLGAMLHKREYSILYNVFAVTAYMLLVATTIIPYMSAYYGVGRVYVTGLVLLAPLFAYGVKTLADVIKPNTEYIGVTAGLTIILLQSGFTGGAVHYLLT